MREMKTIVDYLAEHKAYHEVKGRKMWIDLQDSKVYFYNLFIYFKL